MNLLSRRFEFQADEFAVKMGKRVKLKSALLKLFKVKVVLLVMVESSKYLLKTVEKQNRNSSMRRALLLCFFVVQLFRKRGFRPELLQCSN